MYTYKKPDRKHGTEQTNIKTTQCRNRRNMPEGQAFLQTAHNFAAAYPTEELRRYYHITAPRERHIFSDENTEYGTGKNDAVQRKVTIEIKLDRASYTGESGRQGETESNMQCWPELHEAFRKFVPNREVENSEGKIESRPWNQCAEPNALSRLVKEYRNKGEKPELNRVKFPKLAYNDITKKEMKPCAVCEQWVSKVDSMLVVNDTLKQEVNDDGQQVLVPFNDTYQKERYVYLARTYKLRIENELESEVYKARADYLEKNKEKAERLARTIPHNEKASYDIFKIMLSSKCDYNKTKKEILEILKIEESSNSNTDWEEWVPKLGSLRLFESQLDFNDVNPEEKIHILEVLLSKQNNLKDKIQIMKEYMEVKESGGKLDFHDYIDWYDTAVLIEGFTKGVRDAIMKCFENKLKKEKANLYPKLFQQLKNLDEWFYLSGVNKDLIKELVNRKVEKGQIEEYKKGVKLTGNKIEVAAYLQYVREKH